MLCGVVFSFGVFSSSVMILIFGEIIVFVEISVGMIFVSSVCVMDFEVVMMIVFVMSFLSLFMVFMVLVVLMVLVEGFVGFVVMFGMGSLIFIV